MLTKEDLLKKQGFIFDFDGTLVDSMWVWDNLLIDFLKKYGYRTPKKLLEEVAYMSLDQSSRYVCELYELPLTPAEVYGEWNDMIYDSYAHEIKLKPGAAEFIKMLKEKGKIIAIATANNKELTEACLMNNNMLNMFDVITYADEVGTGKADPAIYIETLRRMGVTADKAVLFEDILKALETAKEIGLDVVIAEDESAAGNKDELMRAADLYIKDFDSLGTGE